MVGALYLFKQFILYTVPGKNYVPTTQYTNICTLTKTTQIHSHTVFLVQYMNKTREEAPKYETKTVD